MGADDKIKTFNKKATLILKYLDNLSSDYKSFKTPLIDTVSLLSRNLIKKVKSNFIHNSLKGVLNEIEKFVKPINTDDFSLLVADNPDIVQKRLEQLISSWDEILDFIREMKESKDVVRINSKIKSLEETNEKLKKHENDFFTTIANNITIEGILELKSILKNK